MTFSPRRFLGSLWLVLVMAMAGEALGGDPDALRESLRLYMESHPRAPGHRTITLPAPLPGQPEHLIRTVYLIPTDRLPPDPAAYEAKIQLATSRIRAALEAIDGFLQQGQIAAHLVPHPANFERDEYGDFRVLVVPGNLATTGAEGYWGDAEGSQVWGSVTLDLFNSYGGMMRATERSCYILLPDVLGVDAAGTMKGYVGGGANFLYKPGSGGVCMMPYGLLETILPPSEDTVAGRASAFLASLCATDTRIAFSDHVGPILGIQPCPTDWTSRPLSRGHILSIYAGVLCHEFLHTQALGHDNQDWDSVMSTNYVMFGGAILDLHGRPRCSELYPSTSTCASTTLGMTVANWTWLSPYFDDRDSADTLPPTADIAWPPSDSMQATSQPIPSFPMRFRLEDPGSGPAFAMIYKGLLWSGGTPVDDSGRASVMFVGGYPDSIIEGRGNLNLCAVDRAWNFANTEFHVFCRNVGAGLVNLRQPETVWVRRPPSEDTRERTGSCMLASGTPTTGCFESPYSSVEEAITQLGGTTPATIILGRGTWPIRTPINLPPGVSLTGEGVGATILDGGGTPITLVSSDPFEDSAVANLTFQNARNGFYGSNARDCSVANCVFLNLTGTASRLGIAGGVNEVCQNTFVRCAGGMWLTGSGSSPAPLFRNNLAAYCTSFGIRFDNLAPPTRDPRSGYNLAFGNGNNFQGVGFSSSYSTLRLPGEISLRPDFAAFPPTKAADLRVQATSPAARAGHPTTEDAQGGRRAIGAWISLAPVTEPGSWLFY